MNRKLIQLMFAGWCLALAGGATAVALWHRSRLACLEQPIAFPHDLHVGKVNLPCLHCHTTAAVSPRAGAPPLAVCMACHNRVKTDSPGIKLLTAHWNNREPLEWNRIHQLPWHVRFTHKRHIQAGVDCAVCHGAVQTMTQVHQIRSLEMGWCVRCHRQHNAATDCWTCHK